MPAQYPWLNEYNDWGTNDVRKSDLVARQALGEMGVTGGDFDALLPQFQEYAKRDIGVGWGSDAGQVVGRLKRDLAGKIALRQATRRPEQAIPAAQAAIADAVKAAPDAKAKEDAERGALAQPLRERLTALNAARNPFDQGYITGQQQQASLAFGGQQHALSGALAGRGMMGSGAEVAQRSALAGAQGASLLDIANQAKTQGIGWEQNRRNAGDALAANISNIMLGGRGQDINQALGQGNLALAQQWFDYGKERDAKNYIDPTARFFMNLLPSMITGGSQIVAGMGRPSIATQGQRYSGIGPNLDGSANGK